MKHLIYLTAAVCLHCSCSKESVTEEAFAKPTKVHLTTNLSSIQESLMRGARNDSKLMTLRAHMVTTEGIYVGYQDGIVSSDKSSASLECEIPASFFGKTVDFYCIGNSDHLSNELNLNPGEDIGKERLKNLYTSSILQPASSYVMGGHMVFLASGDLQNGTALPIRRTMSKLYVVPGDGVTAAEQAKLKVESIRIVNGTSAGYLFKEEMVSEKQDRTESITINKTVDQLGVNSPLCYLYPVSNVSTVPSDGSAPASDGKFYVEIVTSYNGQAAVTKYKSFAVDRNKRYKMTYSLPAPGSADFDITISDWEEDTDVGSIG